jgi:hypothetical protein
MSKTANLRVEGGATAVAAIPSSERNQAAARNLPRVSFHVTAPRRPHLPVCILSKVEEKKQKQNKRFVKKNEGTPSSAIATTPTAAAMEFSGGGASLSEMYQSARRLLLSARDGVACVERLASAPTSSAPLVGGGAAGVRAVAEEVRREVAQIQTLCAQMDRLWRSIPAKGQRDLWKR